MEAAVRVLLLIVVLMQSSSAVAEENPISTHNKGLYSGVKKILVAAAERMPEENYSFKPVESVRSFGAIVGHVADSQYIFCSRVRGEKNPGLKIEQTKTSKADLVSSLKDAFAYCDKAYDGMNDASAAETVKMFGGDTPKIGILTVNEVHSIEHYGNLVTYMRMKGIVPPTSDADFMKTLEPKKQ